MQRHSVDYLLTTGRTTQSAWVMCYPHALKGWTSTPPVQANGRCPAAPETERENEGGGGVEGGEGGGRYPCSGNQSVSQIQALPSPFTHFACNWLPQGQPKSSILKCRTAQYHRHWIIIQSAGTHLTTHWDSPWRWVIWVLGTSLVFLLGGNTGNSV